MKLRSEREQATRDMLDELDRKRWEVPIRVTSREQAIELYGPLGADAWDVHVGRLVEMPFRVFKLSKPAKPYPAPEVDPVVRTNCPTLGESCVGRVVWLSDNTARFECDGAECEVGRMQRDARARGRCADCKHWGSQFDGDEDEDERDERRTMQRLGTNVCVRIEPRDAYGSRGHPHPAETHISIDEDAGHAGAVLVTRDDFGCVLFERREAKRG